MPPSGLKSVTIGTTASRAQTSLAAGNTGVYSDMVYTHAHRATHHGQVREMSLPFHSLPYGVISPINVDILDSLLVDHPQQAIRQFLVSGFRVGFDIGFRGRFQVRNARPRNLRSALDNPEPVTEAIRKELERGHTSGPFPSPPSGTHIALL